MSVKKNAKEKVKTAKRKVDANDLPNDFGNVIDACTPKERVSLAKTPYFTYKQNKRGAPRTISLTADECEDLGQEMVDWVELNKPTHLSEWFSIHKMITWKQWDALCQVAEFLPYYEIALNLVAKNSRDGTLDKSIAQRFLGMYHRDLRQYDSEVKSEEAKQVPEELMKMFVTFASSISDKQKKS